jgi:hypothetical protein
MLTGWRGHGERLDPARSQAVLKRRPPPPLFPAEAASTQSHSLLRYRALGRCHAARHRHHARCIVPRPQSHHRPTASSQVLRRSPPGLLAHNSLPPLPRLAPHHVWPSVALARARLAAAAGAAGPSQPGGAVAVVPGSHASLHSNAAPVSRIPGKTPHRSGIPTLPRTVLEHPGRAQFHVATAQLQHGLEHASRHGREHEAQDLHRRNRRGEEFQTSTTPSGGCCAACASTAATHAARWTSTGRVRPS